MAPLDVLIVTAVAEEYAAVLAAGGGEAAWQLRDGLRVRDFEGQGGLLTVAVTQAHRMGAPGAVEAAGALRDPGVRCLAMCGVCAGKRNDVELGDVIIADRVFQYDTGKKKAEGIALDLVRRKLAQARPEAFLPYLATSLHNLGLRHRDNGHPEAALACAQEALDSLWPLYFRLPAAFAINTGDYLRALRERLAALDLPPTPDLLAREAHFRATTPGILPDLAPPPPAQA